MELVVNNNTTMQSIIIKDAIKKFIVDRTTRGLSKRTISGYEAEIYNFLKHTNIDDSNELIFLSKDAIDSFIIKRMNEVKPGTINVTLRAMRAFLYWCMSQNYLPHFDIQLFKYQLEEQPVYSKDELFKLLIKPINNFSDWRSYAAIATMVSLGTRASTLCSIAITDIDFNDHQIVYRHLKNKRIACVPLSPQLSNILKEYITLYCQNQKWLFCDTFGNQLTVSALRQSIKKYCKRRNVEYKGIHSFRRSFAKEYIMNGGNAFSLQKMLTHSTLAMSAKYVNLYGNDLKMGFENLSPLDTIKR